MIFSILIPSKNGEKDIDGCINSVLDQKFDSFELIIGDNNNNEKFKNIISKYNKHENIKIITHKIDVPVTDNWQSCLDVSIGDYIIMLGDDDGLLPNSLEDIFSLSLLEAVGVGIPSIAFDIEANPEIFENNCGLTVNKHNFESLANSIDYLLNNEDERNQISQNAIISIPEKYNWDNTVTTLEKYYLKVKEISKL